MTQIFFYYKWNRWRLCYMLCFMFRYEGPGATRKFFNLTERLRRALKNKIKKRKVLRKFRATHPWSTAGSNYHLRLLEACWSNLKHLTLGGRGGGVFGPTSPPHPPDKVPRPHLTPGTEPISPNSTYGVHSALPTLHQCLWFLSGATEYRTVIGSDMRRWGGYRAIGSGVELLPSMLHPAKVTPCKGHTL